MKTISALLADVPSANLRLTESGDQTRLRPPVLALESDGAVLAYASAWGGPKRRQEAENALTLFKLLVEKGLEVTSDDDLPPARLLPLLDVTAIEAERDALKEQVAELQEALEAAEAENVVGDDADKFAAALDEILSADVTSAKRAKEIAAGVRG